jgi:hypothetical protein
MHLSRVTGFALVCLAGCAVGDPPTEATEAALTGADGNAYVNFHRDRLLRGYALDHGLGSAAAAWASFAPDQRTIFLLHTDLLGNRTLMVPESSTYIRTQTDACGTAGETCGTCSVFGGQLGCGTCAIQSNDAFQTCNYVSAYECYQQGQCFEQRQPRTDWSMALEHVTKLYEVMGGNGSCSGSDKNRSFFAADSLLINAFRNRTMPEWTGNSDIGAVHGPFNNRSETLTGRPFSCDGPDGQVQFYSYDWQGQGFTRGNKFLPADGLMFELDNDFNTIHDSNPTCFYCGGQYGVQMYLSHWQFKGNAQPVDLSYAPSAGVTCSLAGPGNISVGQTGHWSVRSTPAGASAFWFGTRNGITDVAGAYAGATNVELDAFYDASLRGSYTRFAQIRDGNGNVVCTTNTVTTNVF